MSLGKIEGGIKFVDTEEECVKSKQEVIEKIRPCGLTSSSDSIHIPAQSTQTQYWSILMPKIILKIFYIVLKTHVI